MIRLAGKAALALFVFAGCAQGAPSSAKPAPTTGAIVDGFPLGHVAEPTPNAATAALAVQALDQRMPSHPTIVAATAYNEDLSLVYGPNDARSGVMTIYLYELADGSYHAAGVYCSVAGCTPWPVYKGR
jgi:hypothetical protein